MTDGHRTALFPLAGPDHPQVVEDCRRMEDVLGTLGRRWFGAVLVAGLQGARRFGEYRRAVDGISDRVLSARLKELEGLGLLRREVVPSTPVQISYHPTESGAELMRSIRPVMDWGVRHLVIPRAGAGEPGRPVGPGAPSR